MLTVGTADTTLLYTGVEALDGLEVHAVDVGLAEFNLTADACSCVDIFGEHRRGQTVFAIVGPLNHLVDIVKLYQRQHWAESFLVDDVHVLRAVVEHGGGIEVALALDRLAATENLGSLLHGVLHLLRHALQCSLLHQRTHVGILHDGGIAHLHGLELLHDDIGEFLLHVLMHIHALGIVANLTGIADAALQDSLGCQFEVGIGEHNGRSLSAQFETHLRDVGRSSLHDLHTGTHATRQAHDAHLGMTGQRITNHGTLTCHHIEQTSRQTALMNHLTDLRTVLRRNLSRLDHDGATRNQRSRSLAGNEEEREVPRQYSGSHADRLLHENHRLVGRITLNHLTLNAAGKLSHIVEIGSRDAYLRSGQGLRLTLFAHDNLLELVEVGTNAISNLMQINGTLGSRHLCPLLLSHVGSLHGLVHILHRSGRLTRSHLLGAGVQHFNPLS